MSDVYITGGGETLSALLRAYYGPTSPDEGSERVRWILAANQWLVESGPMPAGRLLFLPRGPQDLACTHDRAAVERAWRALSDSSKSTVVQGLRRNEPGFWESLVDTLDGYGIFDGAGDVNTVAAGAAGAVTARASDLGRTLTEVDGVLREYASAHAHARNALKPRIRAAYARMNNAFGNDLRAASARLEASGRLGSLRSSRQGMKRALMAAQKGSQRAIVGSTTQAVRIMKVARYGKAIAPPMIVLDLSLRGYNIARADDKVRATVGEVAGLAASSSAGLVAYKACLTPALALTGPWALAICLLPAGGAALLADKAGKAFGERAYDASAAYLR